MKAYEVVIISDALNVIIRGLIAFASLLIYTRILGKQHVSQLTLFDYILGITIGSTASSMTTDLNDKAYLDWIGLTTWFLAVLALQWVTLKSRRASKTLEGEPTVVIMNGKIMEEALREMRFRLTDLLEALRQKDVFDLSEVEFAVLETSGNLSVLKKSQYQAVTAKEMNISTEYKGISTELIYDGVVIGENLKQVKLDKAWLYENLKRQGINDPAEVFVAALDTSGNLFIDKYKDHLDQIVDPGDYH